MQSFVYTIWNAVSCYVIFSQLISQEISLTEKSKCLAMCDMLQILKSTQYNCDLMSLLISHSYLS